jgi:hypothetical protein
MRLRVAARSPMGGALWWVTEAAACGRETLGQTHRAVRLRRLHQEQLDVRAAQSGSRGWNLNGSRSSHRRVHRRLPLRCARAWRRVRRPTTGPFEGEITLPHLKVTVSDHKNNPFGIQWQRYWEGAPYPELVKTVPHVAFEVDDLEAVIKDRQVIIEPNSPSQGVLVAFIEVNGAPVELMHVDPRDPSGTCRCLVLQAQSRARGARVSASVLLARIKKAVMQAAGPALP